MGRQKEYYVFARANQMQEHEFTDDVAICKAVNKAQAIKLFSKLYSDVKSDEVTRVKDNFNAYGVYICTDY